MPSVAMLLSFTGKIKLKYEKCTNPTKKMQIYNPLTSNQCHEQLEIKTLFKKLQVKKMGVYNMSIK